MGACTRRWLRCRAAGDQARSSKDPSPEWANLDASRPPPSGTPAGDSRSVTRGEWRYMRWLSVEKGRQGRRKQRSMQVKQVAGFALWFPVTWVVFHTDFIN